MSTALVLCLNRAAHPSPPSCLAIRPDHPVDASLAQAGFPLTPYNSASVLPVAAIDLASNRIYAAERFSPSLGLGVSGRHSLPTLLRYCCSRGRKGTLSSLRSLGHRSGVCPTRRS